MKLWIVAANEIDMPAGEWQVPATEGRQFSDTVNAVLERAAHERRKVRAEAEGWAAATCWVSEVRCAWPPLSERSTPIR